MMRAAGAIRVQTGVGRWTKVHERTFHVSTLGTLMHFGNIRSFHPYPSSPSPASTSSHWPSIRKPKRARILCPNTDQALPQH